MRKIIGTLGAAVAIVALMATSAASAMAEGSNPYREAPRIMLDSSADNTDLFASTALGGAKSFVGPADDPFFVDLGVVFDGIPVVFDGINIDKPGRPMIGLGNQGGGRDDVAGFIATSPSDDLKNFGAPAVNPEPARTLNVCGPCGMDGGTGMELLFNAIIEPDIDADGLGDETQDPDGGGLGQNWEEDWFEDYGSGDQLDEFALVNSEPLGGSPTPTSNPVLAAALT